MLRGCNLHSYRALVGNKQRKEVSGLFLDNRSCFDFLQVWDFKTADEQSLMFVFFCNQTDSAIQPCDDGGPFKDRQ